MNTDIVKEKAHVDLILSWPKSMDYPLWRDFILEHTEYFNKIIIVFTETNAGVDYSDFIKSSLPVDDQFIFLDAPATVGAEDWRNNAVNLALEHSSSTWIWFTEQDLFITDPRFWSVIALKMLECDVIGYKEGNERMHPANMFVKRQAINKTSKDFGIVPDKSDHFGRFFWQLRHTGAKIHAMQYDGMGQEGMFYHMNGLSHNLALIQRGEEVTYKPEEFNEYLKMTLQSPFLDPRYEGMVKTYLLKVQDANIN